MSNKLVASLRELGAPWDITISEHDEEYSACLIYPDGCHHQCMYLYKDKPWYQRDIASLTGFLVAQLEARGLRRDVDWVEYADGGEVCRVHIYPDWEPECLTFRAATELEAHLQACLALPAEPQP